MSMEQSILYDAIDWPVIVLLAAMIPVGGAPSEIWGCLWSCGLCCWRCH
ncbi:MAG: di/tricarboxylate transporter [Motiliproteus sp.]|jgi:di/tricarboxylate transporter